MRPWTDSHAHLYDLNDASLSQTCALARAAGVGRIVTTATDFAAIPIIIDQCKKEPMLRAAVGVSPPACLDLPADWLIALENTCKGAAVIGIGEAGLDCYHQDYPPLEVQLPVFEAQCKLAVVRALPIIVHSRGAELHVCETLRRLGVKKALFHCFTGARPAAEKILDAGYYISFSGIITFAKATLADIVLRTPLDRILIETDSPYLAPVPHRGQTNQPAWVSLVGQKVAAIKQLEPEAVAEKLEENFTRLFGEITP
ncbi:MAG: TatD family hydrolase [Chitinivibrionales bacterium]|nr:TatD family hydrolase [Chitinivibrionales bacterium]